MLEPGTYKVKVKAEGYKTKRGSIELYSDMSVKVVLNKESKSSFSEDAAQPSRTATTITHHGITYGTVKSPYTGKIWLDRNLGAKRVCLSYNDEQCYGDYYQWGRDADGHQKPNSNNFTKISDTPWDWKPSDSSGKQRQAFWSKTDGSGICPVGFRVPTITEQKTETVSNGVNNQKDAFSNFLKLPSAGRRDGLSGGGMGNRGRWGDVWSASTDDSPALYLGFDSDSAGIYHDSPAFGYPVRCLND